MLALIAVEQLYMETVQLVPGSKTMDELPSAGLAAPYTRPQPTAILVIFAISFAPEPLQRRSVKLN